MHIGIVTAIGLLILVVAILIGGSFYFYNVAIKRNEKLFLGNNKDLEQIHQSSDSVIQPTPVIDPAWVDGQLHDEWHMTSTDKLQLTAYYIAPKQPSHKVVILAHGYTSKGKDMGSFAKFYYEKLGYHVVMPDSRGHGNSEGNYIGFGWIDRQDYLSWIDETINKLGTDIEIVLHGISMGGAAVMMVSGEALPQQVKAIVEDCGYTSVQAELQYQLKRIYKLPSFPIMQVTSMLTKLRAGYHFHEASAIKQSKNNTTPMLFIHGDDDTFVPAEMVWQLYDVCTAEKDILIIEGAGHGMAYSIATSIYEHKVTEFLAKYIDGDQ